MLNLNRKEADDYIRCVQAGTLQPKRFKVEAALTLLGMKPDFEQFTRMLQKAGSMGRGRNPAHILVPAGSGRNR